VNVSFRARQEVSVKKSERNERQTERKLNTHLLPIFVVFLALLYGWTGYRGWLVLLIGIGGAWLLATLWILVLERGLSIERKLHLAWATVGDTLHEQLKVINKGWLPAVWVEIVDISTTLVAPVRLVSDVDYHATRTRRPSHLARRRGLYTLGPTRLRTGDPFGIYTLTIQDRHSSTVLVTPPILLLPQLHIVPGGWTGDRQRRPQGIERNISDAGIRDYLPGDSLRRIHWRASAHHDNLMVRQLEAAASGDWWIFVDLNSSVQAGSGQDSTLELSIILAASLAERGFKERRRVGLVLAGPELVRLEPSSDPAQRWRILRALSVAGSGNRPLADLFQVRRLSRTATRIIITPASNPGWVASLGRRHENDATAILVEPTEFGSTDSQGRVISALAHNGVPYIRIPRMLLEEAYPHLSKDVGRRPGKVEPGKRYLKQGKTTWQNMG
jgi:uncharacterized protein (DUF58 family)